ncbi:MAG TPA: heavy-metal-associated domain-containing protein [Gammaproteobacteria bacterium]|nr:heavy-metal-associated domain-containing protein [Gammaproteobacteria bacterium]
MNETASNKTGVDALDDAFIVHRSLRIQGVHHQDDVQAVQRCLAKQKGIKNSNVDVKRARLKITYNAAQIGFGVIEKVLTDAGYPPGTGWWSGLKSGWYRYLDENAQTNARSKGGACCSNPSDIYANRRK